MSSDAKKASSQSGKLIAFVGGIIIIGAALSPMHDALIGWLFGGVFLLAGFVCSRRPAPKSQGADTGTDSAVP